jgi:hypothetical protein
VESPPYQLIRTVADPLDLAEGDFLKEMSFIGNVPMLDHGHSDIGKALLYETEVVCGMIWKSKIHSHTMLFLHLVAARHDLADYHTTPE